MESVLDFAGKITQKKGKTINFRAKMCFFGKKIGAHCSLLMRID